MNTHPNLSLRQTAAQGVKWNTISSISLALLGFIQLAVLARILSPEDFGLMAMMMVVVGFAQAYMDMGVSMAIIHRQDTTREQLSSLYWLNIFSGIMVFVIILVCTPLIADFYQEPRLNKLMLWLSLVFIIAPIGQQFQILLQKELKFKTLFIVEFFSSLVGTVSAIVIALMGMGVFSLISKQLVFSVIRAMMLVCYWWKKWHPAFHFNKKDLKGYLGFGIYQMGERSLVYFINNVDILIIGRYLGPEILGVYNIASQAIGFPAKKINPILNRVAFPVFSKKQSDNAALRRGYKELLHLLAIIIFPLMIGLAVSSPVAIPVLLGEKWSKSAVLIQFLFIAGIFRSIANASGFVILAKGRADISFLWNLFIAITLTLGFRLVVKNGEIIFSLFYSLISILYFIPLFFILNRLISLRWGDYFSSIKIPAICGIVMGLATWGVLNGSFQAFNNKRLSFALVVISGAIIYSGLTYILDKSFVLENIRLLIVQKAYHNKV